MFEEIFTNPGFSHITERILLDLDVRSLLRCTLVNKALRNFVKSLEGPKLTPKYLKMVYRIRFRRFLVHDRWKTMIEMIFKENNFYKIRDLTKLLSIYYHESHNDERPFPSDIYDHFNSGIESSYVKSGNQINN